MDNIFKPNTNTKENCHLLVVLSLAQQPLAATCSHLQLLGSHLAAIWQPLAQAATCSSSHLLKQPLAATCSHSQTLAPSGCSKWLQQVAAKWLLEQVAAKWLFFLIKLRTSCAHNADLSTLSTFWIHCMRKFQLLASSRIPLLSSRFQWQWFLMLKHSSRVQLEVCWRASAYPNLSCWSAAGNPCWTASFKAVVGQLMILWFNHGNKWLVTLTVCCCAAAGFSWNFAGQQPSNLV